MTLQTLNKPFSWPGIAAQVTNTPALGTQITLDAAGEYDCFIIQAKEAMSVATVGFLVNTATGSPTVDIRVETVDPATGLPTGTLWAANTNLVTGAVPTGWSLFTLTAAATITKGQIFAVKIAYASGTSLVTRSISNLGLGVGLNYRVANTGTPTKAVSAGLGACMAIGSSSTAFYSVDMLIPVSSITNNTFNNTSSARRGLRFQVPFTCRCAGIRHWNSTSAGDFNAIIFDDAGNVLSSSTQAFEGDTLANLATSANNLFLTNPVILSPGTWYRAALEPSSATNITLYIITAPSANYLSGMPGGTNAHYTTYVASSWTDTATDVVPLMDILIDQLDDGAGSGGYVIGG